MRTHLASVHRLLEPFVAGAAAAGGLSRRG
jgi:hypothetical protein